MVWKPQIVIDVWSSCSEKLFRSALVWNLLSFVNSTQNFIWWLVNGMKTSDCHHLNMSPSEKIIHFHINMNMSPYDLSPNAYYSYQSPFWYEILRWWQVWISYQASIWWHLSPYGGLVWKFFIPSLHMVTNVTI